MIMARNSFMRHQKGSEGESSIWRTDDETGNGEVL